MKVEETLDFSVFNRNIPQLGSADVTGEIEIIDLTVYELSPVPLVSELPPFVRQSQEEQAGLDDKRMLVDESEQPPS